MRITPPRQGCRRHRDNGNAPAARAFSRHPKSEGASLRPKGQTPTPSAIAPAVRLPQKQQQKEIEYAQHRPRAGISPAVSLCVADVEKTPHTHSICMPGVCGCNAASAPPKSGGIRCSVARSKASLHINKRQICKIRPKTVTISYHKTAFLSTLFLSVYKNEKPSSRRAKSDLIAPKCKQHAKIIYINNLHKSVK
jgi:hypothetical protein